MEIAPTFADFLFSALLGLTVQGALFAVKAFIVFVVGAKLIKRLARLK